MLHWVSGLLYESAPAEFRSTYGVDESVQRLSAVTSRWGFSLGETQAVGRVSADSVRLQRVIPMVRNGFKPFFVGRFEIRDGVTVLTGHFGMSAFAKAFTTLWLAMAALFTIGFLAADFSSKNSATVWLPIFPLLMLVAGLGFVRLGKWFARNDVAWLSGVITQALSASVVPVPQRPETDVAAVAFSLKGVALVLAASSVMTGVAAAFTGARVLPIHWQAAYAIAELVLAVGVWRRQPWAWWAGFLALGMAVVTSLLAVPAFAQSSAPPIILVVFGAGLLVVVLSWGAWWYGQRKHFLWSSPAE
jgi:hypothetical protein